MKALPMWQPWAQLVVIGAKRVETRSWSCPDQLVGERIAIHATKTAKWVALKDIEPFRYYDLADLYFGGIIGTAVVARCDEITADAALALEQRNWHESAFGNYDSGRFAWSLTKVRRLTEPMPRRGRQGMFDVPDRLGHAVPVHQHGSNPWNA